MVSPEQKREFKHELAAIKEPKKLGDLWRQYSDDEAMRDLVEWRMAHLFFERYPDQVKLSRKDSKKGMDVFSKAFRNEFGIDEMRRSFFNVKDDEGNAKIFVVPPKKTYLGQGNFGDVKDAETEEGDEVVAEDGVKYVAKIEADEPDYAEDRKTDIATQRELGRLYGTARRELDDARQFKQVANTTVKNITIIKKIEGEELAKTVGTALIDANETKMYVDQLLKVKQRQRFLPEEDESFIQQNKDIDSKIEKLQTKIIPYTEDQKKVIALEAIMAIQDLHNRGILHRDIKEANLMIDGKLRVTAIDFGMSKKLPSNKTKVKDSPCGTPGYMAPEVNDGNFSFASDAYALGQVLKGVGIYPGLVQQLMHHDANNRPHLLQAMVAIAEDCQNNPAFTEVHRQRFCNMVKNSQELMTQELLDKAQAAAVPAQATKAPGERVVSQFKQERKAASEQMPQSVVDKQQTSKPKSGR